MRTVRPVPVSASSISARPCRCCRRSLAGASNELKELILSNMSMRAAESLREDLESRGPVRLSEVEAQQKDILKIVRRLADEGQIVIGGGGADDAFV